MTVVSHKYILHYKKWDTKDKPKLELSKEEYKADVHKSREKVVSSIHDLIGPPGESSLYLQLYCGAIPDKGDLLDRTILFSWNPASQILHLTLPFSTVIVEKQRETEKYEWLVNQFRLRSGRFHAQISKNPFWLTYINGMAFTGANL